MLRHKSVLNNMKCIHTTNFTKSEFETTNATPIEEILELKKSGWQKYDEMTINVTAMHSYCKPRRFQG
jgi:hypothetical protein